MAQVSDARFLTHHALRIKGFALSSAVAEVADRPLTIVEQNLSMMQAEGHANFRELKSLWQITPEGREVHISLLAADLEGVRLAALGDLYGHFLEYNASVKHLCTDWQLRDGEPNDHTDATYDAHVLDRLVALHERVVPVIDAMAGVVGRLAPYGRRLDVAQSAVRAGDLGKFTGVMCGSYHDVWMELHEDLILTQGIDRSREGSF
jgi:hypothetical protein